MNWTGSQWAICIPGMSRRVMVDAALMDVTRQGQGYAEGYIVSVHGLSQEAAADLHGDALRALGGGAQVRNLGVCHRGTQRKNLLANGTIQST